MRRREPREEYRRVRELLSLTSKVVDAPPPTGLSAWLGDLQRNFEHLRAHLYMHVAIEERGGLLGPVMDQRPTLAPHVERIRARHQEQLALADRIHADLGRLPLDDHRQVEACRHRIHHLITEVRRQAETKALLLTSAFCLDIGGEA